MMNGMKEQKTELQKISSEIWLARIHETLDAAAQYNKTAESYNRLTFTQRKATAILGNACAESSESGSMQKLTPPDVFKSWYQLTVPQRNTVAHGMQLMVDTARHFPQQLRPGDIARADPAQDG